MNDEDFEKLPRYKKLFWGAVLCFGIVVVGFLVYVGYAYFFGDPGKPIITPSVIGAFVGGGIAAALLSLTALKDKPSK